MKKINWKLVAAVSVLILVILYVFAFYRHSINRNIIRKLNLRMFEDYIRSYGHWSIAAFLVISTIRPLAIIIPITIITLIAGGIYGPVYGFLLAMLSIFISSNVAFFISRYIGRSFVEKLIRKRAEKLNLKLEKSGFKIIFIMRVSGVFPLDLVSYAAGLTKVRYKDFILATILGSAPETFSVAYMGHHMHNPISPGFILSVVLVILTMGVPHIYAKIKEKNALSREEEKRKKIV